MQGQFFVPVYKMSFLLSLLSRDCVSIQTGSKKSRMPFRQEEAEEVPEQLCSCRCIVHGMAGCVKTEKAALAGPPSSVVSTAAVAVKFD